MDQPTTKKRFDLMVDTLDDMNHLPPVGTLSFEREAIRDAVIVLRALGRELFKEEGDASTT